MFSLSSVLGIAENVYFKIKGSDVEYVIMGNVLMYKVSPVSSVIHQSNYDKILRDDVDARTKFKKMIIKNKDGK